MKFNICNIKIFISFWFFAIVALFAALDASALSLYFALPVLMHELGHLIVMKVCGIHVKSIRFTAFSVDIQRNNSGVPGYGKEIAVSLGGIVCNLATALCVHLFAFHSMRAMLFTAANIAVAGFNLLPIGSLDGGMLVRLLTERFFGTNFAFSLSKIFSFIVLVPLFAAAIFLVMRPEHNFTLLAMCVYLLLDVIFLE